MLRSSTFGRYLLLVALVSALLVPLVSAHDRNVHSIARRDIFSGIFNTPSGDGGTTGTSDTAKTTGTTSQTSDSSSTTTQSSTTADTTSTTSSSKTSSSGTTTSPTNTNTNSPSNTGTTSTPSKTATDNTATSTQSSTSSQATTTPPQTTSPSPSPSSVLSTSLSTDAEGSRITVIVTVPASATSASSSATQTASGGGGSPSSGLSTGGIIGLSVAGGVMLLSVVAFAVFKFSRKKYLDEYDDAEAIKWPELNTHGDSPHALPTHRTGNAGFETSSEINLTARPDSRAGSIAPSAAASAVDLYPAHQDPYAVPPLPHLNPNVGPGPGVPGAQPYRDDPAQGYYDPYNGPVPRTLEGEAIPMTQIGGRARSPMPMGGRMSPAPGVGPGGMPMGGRMSPAPGLQAPHIHAPRAMSPGPGPMYGGGYGA
ncbi:hypothetical protein WOLCODRAFT_141212 [Wolfiporia cocos MD-104 SS10]|uniref:Mid2 domain-containing protein n=1 Tax=Wolfiporia cocos (strain MD-104) TaxID=742152 RepID=A0A2H3JCR0_WOLCO|nr:hypothetical protein WOLCODRAFT_141212 [Wolfiporia cocos MD-104 SS10]